MSRRRKKKMMQNRSVPSDGAAPVLFQSEEFSHNNRTLKDLFSAINNSKIIYKPNDLPRRSFSTFSKTELREYMQDPNSYAEDLRNLSRYLYTRSMVYNRIVNNNATMINPRYRSIIPEVDLTNEVDSTKLVKSYNDTIDIVDKMNLSTEIFKAAKKCWIEDIFFGVYYYFEDEGGIALPIDPDYCQIDGIYSTGDFRFSMNMSYFQKNQTELELLGAPFDKMWEEYQSDTQNNLWVPVPDEYCMCFKVNIEDTLTPLPPLMPLFDSIINLEDLKEITAVADEQQIYKMLAFKMPLLDNTKRVNDFAVDPDLCIEYFDKVKDDLPEFTDAVITPMPFDSVSFNTDQAADVNKIENSSKNILKTSGQTMLAEQEGSTAVLAALKSDSRFAITALLPQIQGWVNRFLSYKLSDPCKVKFLEVTEYTKDSYKESLIKDMNYGVPFVTALGVLNGYSEKDMVGMAKVNQALGLEELFKPLATASTRSSEDGKPTDAIPSSEADASRDKADRSG